MTAANPMDRILEPIRAIIREEVAKLSYFGTWEYAVVAVNDDGTVNANATDSTAPFPSLNNLPIRSGPEGATGTPTAGNLCYVRFINGDPARPVVVGNQSLVETVTVDATETVQVGPSVSNAVVLAGGDAPIARDGDAVTVYFPKTPTPVTGMVISAPGTFVGTITFLLPAVGVITTGNPRVVA